jgi:serine O-acetyltransferase
MNRYETGNWSDAAVRQATGELVQSMLVDTTTRLRAPERRGAESGASDAGLVSAGSHPGKRDGEGGVFRAANLVHVREMTELLRRLMFPGFFDPDPLWDGELEAHVTRLIDRVAHLLYEETRGVMRYASGRGAPGGSAHTSRPDPSTRDEREFAGHVVSGLLGRLAHVRRMLALDVQAAYDGDPAAEHTDEIVLCYPGLDVIFNHRIAHELYLLGVPLLPRVMSEQAHSRTGIDVHPGAKIGESFFIDHGSATVLGETSVIGKQVKIYQGVTLGAKSFPKDDRGRAIKGLKRHPTIGDRVTIYAGAVILGGDTVIGDDCVIAGGVFVTSSVPPGHVVQQTRAELVLRPAPGASASSGQTKSGGMKGSRAGEKETGDIGWLEDGAGI